jgi:serine/threonine-protein kinase
VLIDEEGAVKLIDFGIAAPAADGDQARRTEVFGSPGHMPPEQLEGRALTPATDVFAVGVLLYEAFTGRPAFRRGSAKECRVALEQPQPALDHKNAELAPLTGIIGAAMQLDEQARPQNAEVLARPLREYLRASDAGDVARRLGERVRVARRRGRSSSPWLVGEGLTDVGTPGPAATPVLNTPGGTRTFATSPALSELTRRVESQPPPRDGASPGDRVGSAPSDAAAGEGTRRLQSSRPPAPLGASEAARATRAANPSRRLRAAAIGVALAVPICVALGAALWTEPGAAARLIVAPKRPVVAWPEAPAQASLAPVNALSPAPSLPAPHAANAATRAAPPSHVSAAPAASPAPSAELVGEASLSLTALPGTHVSVAGQDYTTPVSGLSLPAGRYQVTFRNATWDGPVSTQIMLLPGKSSRVHADFTNEPPRVVVR